MYPPRLVRPSSFTEATASKCLCLGVSREQSMRLSPHVLASCGSFRFSGDGQKTAALLSSSILPILSLSSRIILSAVFSPMPLALAYLLGVLKGYGSLQLDRQPERALLMDMAPLAPTPLTVMSFSKSSRLSLL